MTDKDKLKKALFDDDEPFYGTRIDERQMDKYRKIVSLADTISLKKYPFLHITTEYKSEIPNTQRNASVFVNVLAPANINVGVLKEAFSRMIVLADNFVVAVLEAGENKEHKIVRLGFGVRDVWVDERIGN